MDCSFELKYNGRWTSQNVIQYYDAAAAVAGFERVLSLTTHLLLNGKVITQSPSAKGFQLYAYPPEAGSWKWTVGLALGAGQVIHALGTAPPDTAFGWLTKSAVAYVIEETLGFEPNFDETLGAQIKQYRSRDTNTKVHSDLSQERFDSLIEKTESGVKAIHRPIVFSNSAETASFGYKIGADKGLIDGYADAQTYEYIDKTITSEDFSDFCGVVSSYNSNTYKGRLYVKEEKRTLPFELSDSCRTLEAVSKVTNSLSNNATSTFLSGGAETNEVCLRALRNESTTGRVKSLFVVGVT